MPDVRLIDANAMMKRICGHECGMHPEDCDGMESETVPCNFYAYVSEAPTIDAQTVKHGHWSECYRDCRCISVICSVCKNPTVISHGCRDADKVTMDYVIERLPYCPKCRSDMRGDAKNGNAV